MFARVKTGTASRLRLSPSDRRDHQCARPAPALPPGRANCRPPCVMSLDEADRSLQRATSPSRKPGSVAIGDVRQALEPTTAFVAKHSRGAKARRPLLCRHRSRALQGARIVKALASEMRLLRGGGSGGGFEDARASVKPDSQARGGAGHHPNRIRHSQLTTLKDLATPRKRGPHQRRAGEDCRGETRRGGYSCMKTDFGSRYASSPAAPCSRPTPEALKPPNGAAASTIPQAFT